ncbi:MAG TPA: hypothetical protein VL404_04410 [Candidatus Eisenbacteria bacterium]|jgi:hypothetical protein|nr:hypothetical protein [Candidatus Eisenbacteria bacterium]
MEKKHKDLLIAGALVLTFLGIMAKGTGPKKRPLPAAASQPAAAPADLSFLQTVRRNEELREAQAAVWEKPWKRDPFLSEASASAVASRLKLDGIVWDEKAPYAMINGKVVKVGDTIEGYRILEIKPGAVVLWSDGGQFNELKLFEESGS